MRALGFEPKKEEIKKMIADIDKEGSGLNLIFRIELAVCIFHVLAVSMNGENYLQLVILF